MTGIPAPLSDAPLSDTPLLDVRGLVCRRGAAESGFRLEVPALTLAAGEAVALTGPSGCGKSTLLDALGLVLRPAACAVFRLADGRGGADDVGALWRRDARDGLARLRAGRIGYVLQTGGLLPFLTVRANIALSTDLLGIGRAARPHVERLVEALGIGPLLERKPHSLSIGERQRVAIARALAHRPSLLLADEPTAALDPERAGTVMALLLDLVRELRTTAVVVSHDWELMSRFGLRRIAAVTGAGPGGALTRFAAGAP